MAINTGEMSSLFPACDGPDWDNSNTITCLVLLITFSVLLGFMGYFTYKFYKHYGRTKKLLVMFLIILNISIFGRIMYFFFEVVGYQKPTEHSTVNGYVIFAQFSSAGFLVALVFNIANTWYQTLACSSEEKPQTIYALIFLVGWLGILLTYIFFLLLFFLLNKLRLSQFHNFFTISYGILGVVLGVTYAVVGLRFYLKFRSTFQNSVNLMRCRVLASILVISTLFIARGILNILAYFGIMVTSNSSRGIAAPLFIAVYFLVGDLILSVYQILSLKFVLKNRIALRQLSNEKFLLENDRSLKALSRNPVYSWIPDLGSNSSEASYKQMNTRIEQDSGQTSPGPFNA